jgi:hypothetical protein
MTYEQALAIAYQRILNGTRAWGLARKLGISGEFAMNIVEWRSQDIGAEPV